jgi:hypothetical protein
MAADLRGISRCQRTLAVFAAPEKVPHPPLSCCRRTLAANVAMKEASPPTRPGKPSQTAGWAGGRNLPLEGSTCGQCSLAPRGAGGWGFFWSGPQAAKLRWHCRQLHKETRTGRQCARRGAQSCWRPCFGRTRRSCVGASAAAEAPWPPALHFRQVSPPARPSKGKPSCRAGGWERLAPWRAARVATVLRHHEGWVAGDSRSNAAPVAKMRL